MRYLVIVVLLFSCQVEQEETQQFDKEIAKQLINRLLDDWHQAAAVADEDVFFGSIKNEGIYLGTDKTERWTKEEFMDWGMKYFTERDTAWAFNPFDRQIYFGQSGKTAWFEEQLDTWMGNCRGSGVIEYIDSKWQIAHYNLAVTIDNDKIDHFIELTTEAEK
ncbi:MAG: nuclear transport factor 2 family protein [Bacteroidota bacterium]